MLSNYPIFTWRPLESALIIQQIPAFVLLLQSISSPLLLLFRNEEGEGRGGKIKKNPNKPKTEKKAYLENAFTYQSNLSRKPSERGTDWKVRITSYESQVKFHTEQTDKACIFSIVVMLHGGKCREKRFRLAWKTQSHSSTERITEKGTLWQSEYSSVISFSVLKAG